MAMPGTDVQRHGNERIRRSLNRHGSAAPDKELQRNGRDVVCIT